MRKLLIYQIVMFVLVLDPGLVAAKSPPKKGDVLPEIKLITPKNPDHRNYLGLSAEGSFEIPQIKAKAVILEVFSMYCPHCQREAPRVNELYQLIEKNPKLRGKVKLVGIGAGNSPFEVDVFRKTYKVPFPLFADTDFSIHKILGEVRTPYFIGVKIENSRGHEVFYSKLGGFDNAEAFLQRIMKLSELKSHPN